MLVCDEAQWMSHECFELWRHLWDDLNTNFALIFVGGGDCYRVLRRYPMLSSRVLIWQEYTRLSAAEVPQVIPSFHPLWAGTDPNLITYADQRCAHGNFRAEQTILEAFEWTPTHLSTIMAVGDRSTAAIGLRLKRSGGRVTLAPQRHLPEHLHSSLSALHTRGSDLEPHETLFLAVALRAHRHSPSDLPPAPWHIVEALAVKGAAMSPCGQPGDQVALIPHPDLLYALGHSQPSHPRCTGIPATPDAPGTTREETTA
ncbi:ATP-binding protein [Nonomuraea soli]|uniref:Uncharacterized protein n=1 Tax=Nonomuraea soli TaxID=1032476 RepID=A0A7W0HW22_9ACTN|nr:ATP-binding protein [Nonomuraea soli]MBA2897803.1 hypothetical protein [Nonomuraea soli]